VRTHDPLDRSLTRPGSRPLVRLSLLLLALVMSSMLLGQTLALPAHAAGRWAPASRATIHPGVMMYTRGAQCTGNFVFTDRRGRVYVGYAAHCAGTGAATDSNGCKARSVPLGTRVRFVSDGTLVDAGTAVGRGRLAYSSWRTMHRLGTRSANACAYNDLALVRVGPGSVHKVNPSVPFWGGPVGLATGGTAAGDTVYSYGNSSLRAGAAPLSPKSGASLGDQAHGWTRSVYTATPGVPGDSGSGYLDGSGRAVGVLSTVEFAPLAASNGVGDLARELAFARRHSGIAGLRLVPGTKGFDPMP